MREIIKFSKNERKLHDGEVCSTQQSLRVSEMQSSTYSTVEKVEWKGFESVTADLREVDLPCRCSGGPIISSKSQNDL